MADRAEFDEFVAWRSDRLLRTAFYLTGDRALAEDLLQAALVKAWFAWGRITQDPESYVRRVLVNTQTSWWRRRWRGETPTGPDSFPDAASGDELDAAVAEREDLWTALRRLPPRQRAVVVLRFLEDLPEQQVARTLGCSVGTVKSQAAKGLAKLRLDPELADHVPVAGLTPAARLTDEEAPR
jgi:RNA polymerase sigma-70 factor (sigma-E family)